MKISCESCGANYAIADAKVLGRLVKVRCKSCGGTILVDGRTLEEPSEQAPAAPADAKVPGDSSPGSPASPGADAKPASGRGPELPAYGAGGDDEATRLYQGGAADDGESDEPEGWSVNLSDTDQRTMTTEQIIEGWLSQEITDDAFVWKDGMDDWVPVLEVEELRVLIEARQVPRAARDSEPAAPSAPGAPVAEKGARAARVGATSPAQGDLFGNVEMAGSEADTSTPEPAPMPEADDKMIGARNENSVLFSLEALKAGAIGAPPTGAGASPARKAPSPPRAGALDYRGAASETDDFLGLDASPPSMQLFNPDANQALLTAPAPEPPKPKPKPKPKPVEAEAADEAPAAEPKKGGKGKVVGITLGVVALVAAALGAGMTLGRPGSQPVAQSDQKDSPAGDQASPTSDDGRSATNAPTAQPSASSAAAADSAQAAGTSAAAGSAAPGATTEKPKISEEDRKRFEEAQRKAAEEKAAAGETKPTEEKKPEEKPAEAASGPPPFNKGAAVAALSAAAGAASGCKRPDGPTGSGRATVTFAPSGRATNANVSGGSFGGTPVGGCVASVFRRAKVPAFTGSPVTVSKSFHIPK